MIPIAIRKALGAYALWPAIYARELPAAATIMSFAWRIVYSFPPENSDTRFAASICARPCEQMNPMHTIQTDQKSDQNTVGFKTICPNTSDFALGTRQSSNIHRSNQPCNGSSFSSGIVRLSGGIRIE